MRNLILVALVALAPVAIASAQAAAQNAQGSCPDGYRWLPHSADPNNPAFACEPLPKPKR
jgi:hypothetical protein